MDLLICPQCGAENPINAEICLVCGAPFAETSPYASLGSPHGFSHKEGETFPHHEEDLSDLLRSLKEDDSFTVDEIDPENLLQPLSLDKAESETNSEDTHKDTLPDWLQRIRSRVIVEEDSVGGATQKIKIAQESVEGEQKEITKQEFDAVIQKIQEKDGVITDAEEINADQTDLSDKVSEDQDDDWLTRIRKRHNPSIIDMSSESSSDRLGDSLLQWLVSLEDGEPVLDSKPEEEPENLGLAKEDTQEVDIGRAIVDAIKSASLKMAAPPRRREVELLITREEQTRADQLTAIILDESAVRPARKREKPLMIRGLNQVMALLLILILSLTLFLNIPGNAWVGVEDPEMLSVVEWSEQLPINAQVLVIANYQAGYAGELNLVAKPIIENLALSNVNLSVFSSSAAGSLLFDQLLREIDGQNQINVLNLGYYPADSFGAFGLAIQSRSNWQIIGQPESIKKIPVGPYDSLLILSDSYEGAMTWIEQYSSLAPELPIYILTTAQTAPLLLPYWESGQVKGIAGGMNNAIHLYGNPMHRRWRAYQVGIGILIFTMLIGLVFPTIKPSRRETGRNV